MVESNPEADKIAKQEEELKLLDMELESKSHPLKKTDRS